jgi:hypothetical protein
MSELPIDALGYEGVVTEYFLALRGVGLMLSPLDAEQVRSWERRGVPVEVVCRGLRQGLEAALRSLPDGATLPRALRAYRLAVEDEWRAYRYGRVGDAPGPPPEGRAARARLQAAREALLERGRAARGAERDAYRAAWRALAAAERAAGLEPTLDGVDRALAAADAALLAGWLAALSRPERAAAGRRAALVAGPRPPGVRPSVHRDALRAHLFDAARSAGLVRLRGNV